MKKETKENNKFNSKIEELQKKHKEAVQEVKELELESGDAHRLAEKLSDLHHEANKKEDHIYNRLQKLFHKKDLLPSAEEDQIK